MNFTNELTHVKSVVAGIFMCGHCPMPHTDEAAETVALELETDGKPRLRLLIDFLPLQPGGTVHRLANAVSGYHLAVHDIDMRTLVGQPVIVSCEFDQDGRAYLRHAERWPQPPRYSAPLMQPGAISGMSGVCLRPAPREEREFPTPIKSSKAPVYWSVNSLKSATDLDFLPPRVRTLVESSSQWTALLEAAKGKAKAR